MCKGYFDRFSCNHKEPVIEELCNTMKKDGLCTILTGHRPEHDKKIVGDCRQCRQEDAEKVERRELKEHKALAEAIKSEVERREFEEAMAEMAPIPWKPSIPDLVIRSRGKDGGGGPGSGEAAGGAGEGSSGGRETPSKHQSPEDAGEELEAQRSQVPTPNSAYRGFRWGKGSGLGRGGSRPGTPS